MHAHELTTLTSVELAAAIDQSFGGLPVILDWGNFRAPEDFPQWTLPPVPRVLRYRRSRTAAQPSGRARRLSAPERRLQVAI